MRPSNGDDPDVVVLRSPNTVIETERRRVASDLGARFELTVDEAVPDTASDGWLEVSFAQAGWLAHE
jgi:hypothetical protein